MNKIGQIVLDVLSHYEYDSRIRVDQFVDIAKSIEANIQAVSIDRDELTSYLYNTYGIWNDDLPREGFYKDADKILSLLKPVKTLGRDKIIKGIMTRYCYIINRTIAEEIADTICKEDKPKLSSENISRMGGK